MEENVLRDLASDIYDICNDDGESCLSANEKVFKILKKLVKNVEKPKPS